MKIHMRDTKKPAWLMAHLCNTPEPPFHSWSMKRITKDRRKVTCKRCIAALKALEGK